MLSGRKPVRRILRRVLVKATRESGIVNRPNRCWQERIDLLKSQSPYLEKRGGIAV